MDSLIVRHTNSSYGTSQPANEYNLQISSMDIARRAKALKYKSILLNQFLADNLNAWLKSNYWDSSNHVKDFSKESGISYGTVWRAMNGRGCSIDILEQISVAVGVPAWKLLYPTF